MSFLSSLTEKVKEVKEILPMGREDGEKGEKGGITQSDPEFEAARKDWQRLSSFLTSVQEHFVQSTHALHGISRPNEQLDAALNTYFRETSTVPSKEVTQFTASVAKLREGTSKFAGMMQSYNIKEEIDSWVAKAAELKKEINQRDTLMLKYSRGEAEHRNAKNKAEQKGMLRDAATVVKLNKMEAEWSGEKEACQALNAKIINDVKGMKSRIVPVLNEQIKAIATSQFWLFWTLSEGYSHWHQQEVNKSSMRQRRRQQTRTGYEDGGSPAAEAGEAAAQKQPPQAPPKRLPPSPSGAGGKVLPTPPPKKTAQPSVTPTPTPVPAPTEVATPAVVTIISSSTPTAAVTSESVRLLELQKRNLEEEKHDLEQERDRLRKEWEEVENEKIRLIRIRKDELQKVEEAKQRNEEDYKERLRQIENKNKVLEAERKAVAEEKIRLENRLKLEEERIEKRKQLEEEYKRMEDERKALEEKKIELAEGKMKKRLEEEWRRLEAKRLEIEEERKKEEERRRLEEETRIEDERKRVAWEAEERRKKEEEARLEEEKERERLVRIKRQMEEERRRLEQTKRRILEEDDVPLAAFTRDVGEAKPSSSPVVVTVVTHPETQQAPQLPSPRKEGQSVAEDDGQPAVTKILVKALYKYDAAEEGELSFAQGEVMVVDYDGDETGWWMAKKRNGEEGIVPANFVKKFDPESEVAKADAPKPDAPKVEEPKQQQPEQELSPKEEGPEVKEREKEAAPVAQPEPSAVAPAKQEEANPHQAEGGDLGKVKALFDYKATEEGELSFKKDDVIVLLEKDNEGGWWIGELNGEMGLFPKTFVAELSADGVPAATQPATTTVEPTPASTIPAVVEKDVAAKAAPAVKKPFGGVKMFPDPVVSSPAITPATTTTTPRAEYVKALFDFTAQETGELSFKEGDLIRVINKDGDGNEGWWTGQVQERTGIFPTNFTDATL